ncbi:hypothetical protein VKT23_010692 [Stygiomarasmius scandens]|uniref:Uncharacterized protein n=1 Tax=Marasmiellus scandens TaxID=2682957 RepID=A0ABR1JDL3_9AGAR
MDWGYQNFDATSMLVLWDRGRWTSLAFWKAAGSENEKSDGSERGLGCLWVGTKISKLSPIFVLFSSPRIRRIQQVHPRICTVPLKAYPFLSDIHDISPALSNLRARVLWLEGWGPAFSCAATTTGHRLLREGANILGGYWWGSHCAIWIVSSTSLEKAEAAFITTQVNSPTAFPLLNIDPPSQTPPYLVLPLNSVPMLHRHRMQGLTLAVPWRPQRARQRLFNATSANWRSVCPPHLDSFLGPSILPPSVSSSTVLVSGNAKEALTTNAFFKSQLCNLKN